MLSKHKTLCTPIVAISALSALLLTSCQGAETNDPAIESDGVDSIEALTELAVAPAEANPQAVSGGTLKLSTAGDPVCLDGHQVSTAELQLLGRIIYDNLVSLDAEGNPAPWLAESWDISDDGTTYTFHLREGVTFSDGAPLDAEAVVTNFDHMAAPETASPLAAAYIDPIESTEILDSHTLQVELEYAYSPFLYVLAQGWLGLISPDQLENDPDATCLEPIGSGPFIVDEYVPGEGVSFDKREDYNWAADYLNHEGPAYLDRIEIGFIADESVRYTSLASGEFDASANIAPQNAEAAKSDPSITYRNVSRIGNPQRLTLNTEREPFDDVTIRQAIALGLDVEGIAEAVGFGEYEPRHAFLSPTTQYVREEAETSWVHDPERAAELLDEAGWDTIDDDGYRTKDGERFTVEFPFNEATATGSLNDLLQSELRSLGIELQLVQLPASEAMQRRRDGNYDVVTGVWHTNTPDALFIVYHSDEIADETRIGQNTSRIQDEELDDLLLQARQTTDFDELDELYGEAQVRLEELVPAVPLYDFYSPWAVRDHVNDVLADSSHGTPLLTLAWLEQ